MNERTNTLNSAVAQSLSQYSLDEKRIEWVSPLASDTYSEYQDSEFLERVGFERLSSRLKAFMKKLPRVGPYKYAVEIRNKWWLTPRFADLLRGNNVALVLQDHSFMPSVERVFST